MKQIRINKGTIGLVFRKGEYRRVMTEGKHWLKWEEQVTVYDLAKPFSPTVDLNLLLADPQLAEKLVVVEVKDHEIAL